MDISQNAFGNCSSITTIDFGALTVLSSRRLEGCTNLHTLKFGTSTLFSDTNVFESLPKLKSIYFYGDVLPRTERYAHNIIFRNSPLLNSSILGGEFASIYVKESLYDSCVAYFSLLSARIVSYTTP